VAEHQHLGLERQVAVGDGDPQGLCIGGLRAPGKRFGRGWSRRFSLRRTMGRRSFSARRAAGDWADLARIDAVQRLLPAEAR
jgi:hypothetical protein